MAKVKAKAKKSIGKTDLVKAGLVNKNAVVTTERDQQLAKMRDRSGEGDSKPFPFVPVVEVDNHSEEEMVRGRKVPVLCEPNFVMTSKNENDEYIKEPIGDVINGTIILVRYMVEKKWSETDTTPYYRSFEFDPAAFQNPDIQVIIKQAGEEVFAGSYGEFKAAYAERYILSAILYVADEIDGKLVRFKLKGVSRSAYWDYAKLFKRPDTVSAHKTKFSIATVSEGGKNYNHIVFNDEGEIDNLENVDRMQTELHEVFDRFIKKNETVRVEAEIVPGEPGEAFQD